MIDKPHLRLRMLAADIRVGSERGSLAARRVAALKHRQGMSGGGTPSLAPVPGASNWVQLGPMATPNGPPFTGNRRLDTGRVTVIAVDPSAPQTLYLGAATGGVWKSTDGGGMWSPMSDDEVSLAIGALTLDPVTPQTVYAGTGDADIYFVLNVPENPDSYFGAGLLKSTNGGMSWNTYGQAEFTGAAFFRIAVHPSNPNRVWAATTNGLFLSDLGGTSWTKLTSGLPNAQPGTFTGCTEIALHPTDPSIAITSFWGSGVYRSTNANTPNPTFSFVPSIPMFVKRGSFTFAPSQPQRVMAAIFNAIWVSSDAGQSFQQTGVPLSPICYTEDYSNNVAIDPTTPDVVYISGYSQLMKYTYDGSAWSGNIIGQGPTHGDHHAFAFDPTNNLHVYAGTDGGIYESFDGGGMWSDARNRGLCLTQFDFIDHHPTSDTVVFGGTQDNGTQQYRNSTVFREVIGGDGGFVAVDFNNPHNVVHTLYLSSPQRSTLAGDWLTWTDVSMGLSGNSLFYPPMVLCPEDPTWIAFGTQQIFIDKAQGTGGWPTAIDLPGATEVVTAINFVSKTLLYCATVNGEVFAVRSSNGGVDWIATPIHSAPFPFRFVWDIGVLPNDSAHIIVGVSGYGTGHVWSGIVPANGVAAWTDISGSGATGLPDGPINAIVIDPAAPQTYYAGSDIGVFRTTNAGQQWTNFGQGLPNTSIYDLRLHGPLRLLRAATHGRGIWERRLDVASLPDVDLYVRHHVMDSGRGTAPEGVGAAFEDLGQHVGLGDGQHHWMCADMKVDALDGNPLAFQFAPGAVDFIVYESRLFHRNAERGNVNHVYVQVHNRGIKKSATVTVKLLFADATAKVPLLPNDFWTAFPNNSANANSPWHPIGAAKTVTVTPTLPTVLEWNWTPPMNQATHSCLLVVVDSPDDPIPAANKLFDVDALVKLDKRTGLKNLHVVDAPMPPPSPAPPPYWSAAILDLVGVKSESSLAFELLGGPTTTLGFFLPLGVRPLDLRSAPPTAAQLDAAHLALGERLAAFDTKHLYAAAATTPPFIPERGVRLALVFGATLGTERVPPRFHVKQMLGRELLGGSTFVLVARADGNLPRVGGGGSAG